MGRDNYRPFFEQAFPKLLGRVFGFNGVCWLAHISSRGTVADVHALLDLLSPTGKHTFQHFTFIVYGELQARATFCVTDRTFVWTSAVMF